MLPYLENYEWLSNLLTRKPSQLPIRPCKTWAPICLASCSNVSGLPSGHLWPWPSYLSSNIPTITLAMAVSLLTSSLKLASSHYFLSHCLLNSLHCIFKIYVNLVHFPVNLTPPMGLKSWGQRSAILLTSVIPAFSRVRSTESVLSKYVLNEQNEWRNGWDHRIPVPSSHLEYTCLLQKHKADKSSHVEEANGGFQHKNTLILNLELNCN